MIKENELFLRAWERASKICDGMQNLEQKGRMREALVSLHYAFEMYVNLDCEQQTQIARIERKVKELQKKYEIKDEKIKDMLKK